MKLKNSFDKILKSRGFKKIELSHVIPSMKALRRSGDIRRNMFSYYDQNFQEFSLRPDLSLSAALKFAAEKSNVKKKYFYSGLAYRKPLKTNDLPIISQFGWEIFNSNDKHKDDKEIIETSLKILKNTKFKRSKLKILTMSKVPEVAVERKSSAGHNVSLSRRMLLPMDDLDSLSLPL